MSAALIVPLLIRSSAASSSATVENGPPAVAGALPPLASGLDPLDPVALGGVAALLGGVSLLASLAPARAAARVEPSVALRAE